MKVLGRQHTFNNNDIFHRGNFDPSTKSDVGHEHGWGEITNKPSTFTPSTHNHTHIQIPDTRNVNDAPSATVGQALRADFKSTVSADTPPVSTGSTYAHILTMNGWQPGNSGSGGHTTQLAFGDSLAIRQSTSTTAWGVWSKFWHSGNFDPSTKSDTSHTHDDKVNKDGDTMTGGLTLPASTTTSAPLNIPHGVAPTTPLNGDMWTTTAAPFVRLNGTTRTVYHSGNAGTAALTTATQAEAEAGVSTTVRGWTPQRVRQAINAVTPTKMSQLENDIGAGGGVKITTSATAPTNNSPGDFWYKEE